MLSPLETRKDLVIRCRGMLNAKAWRISRPSNHPQMPKGITHLARLASDSTDRLPSHSGNKCYANQIDLLFHDQNDLHLLRTSVNALATELDCGQILVSFVTTSPSISSFKTINLTATGVYLFLFTSAGIRTSIMLLN